MSLLSAEEIHLLGCQPVPGDSPAGSNVRLESEFESIEQEIAKLDSLTAEDPVRWHQVQDTARQILQERSKDYLVACYLTRALCEVDVLQGLQQGIAINKGLVDTWWESGFPPRKRLRGRAQAFDWLVEKCQPMLEQHPLRGDQLEQIAALEAEVVALDELLLEKMADSAPNLAEFRHTLRRMRQGLETEQRKQDVAVTTPSATTPRTPATGESANTGSSLSSTATSAPAKVVSDRDLMAVFRNCQDQLRNASVHLASKNPLDVDVFRINRFITWLGVTQLPPHTANKTQLRPIAKEKMDVVSSLYQDRRWRDLIIELEPSLVKTPFWLTGQRLVSEALNELNAELADAQVRQAVRDFVKRYPDVVQLCFNDDTPFADEKTRNWIQNLAKSDSRSTFSCDLVVDSQDLNPAWATSYQQATELAEQKQTRAGLDLFQLGVMQSASRREQALWRFNQARFCYEQGLHELALPLLQSMDQQLQQQGVEDWEPQLSKRVLELQIRLLQETGDTATATIDQLQARLCRFDLALAFDLFKK